jgi:hypothetical protein
VIEAVVAVSIVWANLAYLLLVGPLLVRRLRGWPSHGGPGVAGVFRLGRWGLGINVVAVLWASITVVNMGWPREEIYGVQWYTRYTAVMGTAALLVGGAVYYRRSRRFAGPGHVSARAVAAAEGSGR